MSCRDYFNQHYKHTHKVQHDAKIPHHSFLAQVKRPGLNLFQEADRHITKLAIETQIYNKDGPIKKN